MNDPEDVETLDQPIRHLTGFEIKGLLGEFSYEINFPREQRFLILFGPNGVGKTHVLRMLETVLRGDWPEVLAIEFSSAKFSFSDSSELAFVRREEIHDETEDLAEGDLTEGTSLEVKLQVNGVETSWSTMNLMDNMSPSQTRRILEMDLGYRLTGPGRYSRRGGPEYSINQIVALEHKTIFQLMRDRPYGSRMRIERRLPDEFLSFLRNLEVTYIKTQRLVIAENSAPGPRDTGERPLPAIEGVSKSIQNLSDQVLAENSKISQKLDRTFPDRLLNFQDADVLEDREIRRQYREQQNFRERLARFHLAGEDSTSVELPSRTLRGWEAKVLSQYLEDSAHKLSSFESLLEKMELFVETANDHFYRKTVSFRGDRSISITGTGTQKKQIPINSLSSGEQHELILLKYLLFDAKPNSIVLIDEPEISLHVAWQLAFLADLEKISRTTNLRFIIATHSPQIIGDEWKSTFELGLNDEE